MASSAIKALTAIRLTLALAILNLGSHSVLFKASHVYSCSAKATLFFIESFKVSPVYNTMYNSAKYCQVLDISMRLVSLACGRQISRNLGDVGKNNLKAMRVVAFLNINIEFSHSPRANL